MQGKKTTHATHILLNDIEKIKAVLANTAKHLKETASDAVFDSIDSVKEKSEYSQEAVEGYVSDKPFKSLGFALMVGAAFGYLLRK